MATTQKIRNDIAKTKEKIAEQQKRLRALEAQLAEEENLEVSRPEEPPLKSLSEPYVNLSAHTAPTIQPLAVSQISSVQTGSCHALLSLRASVPPFV